MSEETDPRQEKAEREAAVGYPEEGIPGADLVRLEAERHDREIAAKQAQERLDNYRKAKGLDEAEEDQQVDDQDRIDAIEENLGSGDERDQFVAERQKAMVEAGATDAEIQEAEHGGNLLAGETEEDGSPAPTPGSDADKQTGEFEDEKAEPEEERDSDADEQRAVLDLSAPDDEKREAAVDARAEDRGGEPTADVREEGEVGDDASRAEAFAAQVQDEVEVPTDGPADEQEDEADEGNESESDDDLTVEEIKDQLRAQGKKVGGNKDELLARLHGEEDAE
jgi:hypothetical protein